MAVVYRFILSSNEDGRASILITNKLLESICLANMLMRIMIKPVTI